MKIVLCGMMGCGKTTVSKALAARLQTQAIDTDAWIVQRHGDISAIFETYGEEYFRTLETQAVQAIPEEVGVVAVGGGLVMKEENVRLLKEQGKLVYLQASKQTLFARLQGDTSRPLLQGEALSARLDSLLSSREGVYASVADFAVSVDGKTPELIADEIIQKLHLAGAGVQ